METIVIAILFVLGLVFSYIALEVKERMYTVVFLLLATLCFGSLLLYIQAYFIGLFYILIYSGLLSVLFASVSNFLEQEKITDNQIVAKEVKNGDEN